ncbi:pollen ole e 1 allergen and extensin family protein [Arabidopsis lyrata subsp. lyrata]|uniref:Pollen ole e 1 allergen and extensin family protein n=1 Tax=Arabidopsis lyrata subsp. lyrata TaxID=81972 RepID=D7LGP2_ARALL|nr:proline-rich protein 3 [Arabidopsis lyrata subsp. lyrata]EFH56570.1 pollen ole e 1 allergen and extensin family protein [Arabidopsis lyrata subsp. lyrata]|eukprot:XP_002880311.1 proline-rich protein 3 [Arabidopsis lyrata subsp. lyrata]
MAQTCSIFFIPYMMLLLSLLAAGVATITDGELLSSMVGVQGLIYCKQGSKLTPLQGAVARVTCERADEYGYEAEDVTVLSQATDAKGYFLATLSSSEVKDYKKQVMKIKECRAFLELSPSDTCSFPTEINRGISGAILQNYRLLENKLKMKLFTVGPFVFSPEETHDKSIPNGY